MTNGERFFRQAGTVVCEAQQIIKVPPQVSLVVLFCDSIDSHGLVLVHIRVAAHQHSLVDVVHQGKEMELWIIPVLA